VFHQKIRFDGTPGSGACWLIAASACWPAARLNAPRTSLNDPWFFAYILFLSNHYNFI
jgi:hypothetical protein